MHVLIASMILKQGKDDLLSLLSSSIVLAITTCTYLSLNMNTCNSVTLWYSHYMDQFCTYTGCGRNSKLIIIKNNVLLKVIDTNFSTSQFTVVLNFFFYIVSLSVYNVF